MIKIVECVGGLKKPDLSSPSQAVQQFSYSTTCIYIKVLKGQRNSIFQFMYKRILRFFLVESKTKRRAYKFLCSSNAHN